MIRTVLLREEPVEGKRLGRHVEHDSRSRDYPAKVTTGVKSVNHRRYGEIFDQGDIGSCTGNAAAGACNSTPLHIKGNHELHEADALDIYKVATTIDNVHGVYPPDDTGSTGLAVGKALQKMGLITEYRWAFNINDAIGALMLNPVITGVPWYEGFDKPNADGLVKIAGQIRGGHEFLIRQFIYDAQDPLKSLVVADNSWGKAWGKAGRFRFTVQTWNELLGQDGDVTVLVRA